MTAYRRYQHLFFTLLFCIGYRAAGQKYNFIQYSVAEGLAQSQPSCFAQHTNRELLIGTLGGLSQFDGSHFTSYNKANGMPHNAVTSIACDRQQRVWVGTPNGISMFDGRSFRNYFPNGSNRENNVSQVAVDGRGTVWAIVGTHLFRLKGGGFIKDQQADTSLCMTIDKSGKIWVFRYPEGIFVQDGASWHREISTGADRGLGIYAMSFGNLSGTLYCITSRGVKIAEKGRLVTPEWLKPLPDKLFINSLLEDSKGNRWVAANDGGVWVYNQKRWIHYTYENGFSNENVLAVYEDVEGNIWLATNGSGIFRFTGNAFTYYDRGSGLSSPSIMSIAQMPSGDLFFAGSNNGLFRMHRGKIVSVPLPEKFSRINTLLCDERGLLWIGTDVAGLWTYDGQQFKPFRNGSNRIFFDITHLYEDKGTIWICALNGLFSLRKDSLQKEAYNHPVYAVQALGTDSLVIGTINGVYIYQIASRQLNKQPLLSNASILCFTSDNRNLYIGTDDRGVVVWNRNTKKLSRINHTNGLSCDYVYSLLKDRNNHIWAGTGCGIDQISLSRDGRMAIKSFGASDGLQGMENNANASFEDISGYLWFGTTKGVFSYNPYTNNKEQDSTGIPKVILQSVKLFSKDLPLHPYADSLMAFSNIPYNPLLPAGQNSLSFTFTGICLANPSKIRYRYQLVGVDKTYMETTQNTVIYPNLPDGSYIFKVWASDAEGNWYHNELNYPFTINTPYYKTWYFRAGIVLLLLAFFFGAVYWRNRVKAARIRWEQKLREEEQARVRQRTAEDFHDEIGNKLTRIHLLATMAESKITQTPADIPDILRQIRKNVTSLYNGSKDIIWSLQPQSDFLDEIILRIRQNTTEMLDGSDIRFSYAQEGEINMHIKLPTDYSRNLIMIFKEAVNNLVKHADAKEVCFRVAASGTHIRFTLEDDGTGFDPGKETAGNGLQNMKRRAERINGRLSVSRNNGRGTGITLEFPLP